MYLKSIEIQGFKSFANKIKFDFHNGITGIVGPNGSGKSNVADAVRWVLGEQRVRQLRGVSMQDIIFAGTESRKPLGYAYVAITLDNSDHSLAVDFEEVTVARRIYRSGESEYLINGVLCRLKDVNELFYDTGIGKEGYSIIGQGQIDRVLSGKPEDRRELFDEAAGIVKFKRRKNEAIRKLEDANNSLARVNDILAELENQVGPLEEQSRVAREYLAKKEELKRLDMNMFLIENDRIGKELEEGEKAFAIASDNLEEVNRQFENVKQEYDRIEEELSDIGGQIDSAKETMNENAVEKGRLEGRIALLSEQIKGIEAVLDSASERSAGLDREIRDRETQLADYEEQKVKLLADIADKEQVRDAAESYLGSVLDEIKRLEGLNEAAKTAILKIVNEKGIVNAKFQRLDERMEQANIRKAELDQRFLKIKSEEEEKQKLLDGYRKQLEDASSLIVELENESNDLKDNIREISIKIEDTQRESIELNGRYQKTETRLESLRNMTERYEGYGNSIKKVMEQRLNYSGIIGVVADIIKVDKKYETAIETALGGNIQNIVTRDENTAKDMIEFLKKNKLGRATFLPLSSVKPGAGLKDESVLKEKGVLGEASDLVEVESKYSDIIKYLLHRMIVVDDIDNAIALAAHADRSLQIVTLEGEFLKPGGSMTGGAFKNSSNLLGRRREIETYEKELTKLSKEGEKLLDRIRDLEKDKAKVEEKLASLEEKIKEQYIAQNTAKMNVDSAESGIEQIGIDNASLITDRDEINSLIMDIRDSRELIELEIDMADKQKAEQEALIEQYEAELKKQDQEERDYNLKVSGIVLEYSNLKQQEEFLNTNINRVTEELERFKAEQENFSADESRSKADADGKRLEIEQVTADIEKLDASSEDLKNRIETLTALRDEKRDAHGNFFENWNKLAEQRTGLEKETTRLTAARERLEENLNNLRSYIWEEYEMTYNSVLPFRDESLVNISKIKKAISGIKDDIRSLGDVNVNAIEDYKNVSERYELYRTQHDDIIASEKVLEEQIEELDEGMRRQFSEQFVIINREFDKAFKELFGGGSGSLELVSDDILESGVRITAQPPGKKLQNMELLSGGERALTAISLLFAIQNMKPSPFCLLDEIEAALDDSNVVRFAKYLNKLTKYTQFIIITHRRGTMNAADRLYGITMQEKGVSTLVSVNLIEDEIDREEEEMKKANKIS
ncbi:MAG: chromosome segregation protein SMC [Lachnospiraceae bacterium]|nr:chromosome segregation protein SMC [Lachnospiraceae bacterium]